MNLQRSNNISIVLFYSDYSIRLTITFIPLETQYNFDVDEVTPKIAPKYMRSFMSKKDNRTDAL